MIRTQIQPGLWLDARRAVFFEMLGVLAVADLHWGYSQSHRAAGNLLPMWGDAEIARDLNGLIADYVPKEMIWIGDSLHALSGREPAEKFLSECAVPTVLLPGNHDRKWRPNPEMRVARGDYLFHHGDRVTEVAANQIEVIGHHHPAFSWYDGAGGRVKLPGLVFGPRKIILPAFSPWAAGAPWNQLLGDDEQLWVISPKRVFAVTPAMLRR
ncbi:metallophosphoesterase [Oleiharenicola lentus]|uniref:metallophosphoesterase n=1 Tax=Oleiharenicola lentus TaxID=2508720 RepID=UPI003F678315